MLGSLVVAQMEMVACEGLDGPIKHGTGCASALQCPGSALQGAVALSVRARYAWYAVRCDTEIMNK